MTDKEGLGVKLTKAQRELLLDLSDGQFPSIYCNGAYRPALALVAAGLAEWKRLDQLAITEIGRQALSEHPL